MMKSSQLTKLVLTILLVLSAVNAIACTCAPQLDFKSKDDLKPYDFVALVQVIKVPPKTGNRFMNLRVSGNIGIKINELFKGDTTSVLYDESFNNDCAFDLHLGEQWLFIGTRYKGKTIIDKCGYSRIYSDSTGKRDWSYFRGLERLDMLRHLYDHAITPNLANKIYYPNGKVEIEQRFKRGLLTGIRKIYYPTGLLYVAEKFKDGKRVAFRNIYHPSGQLINQTIYKNGLKTQIIGYQDTTESAWYINFQIHHNNDLLFGDKSRTPLQYKLMLDSLRGLKHWDKQVSYSRKFMSDGRSYVTEGFNYKGDTTFKAHLDWDKKISEEIHFLANGKVEYTMKRDQKNNQQFERDYDRKGGPRDFNQACESCKFYFDASKPPEATPEAIYF